MAKHRGSGLTNPPPHKSLWRCVGEGHWESRAKIETVPCVTICCVDPGCWEVYVATVKSVTRAAKSGGTPFIKIDPRTDISVVLPTDEVTITPDGEYFKHLSVAKEALAKMFRLG